MDWFEENVILKFNLDISIFFIDIRCIYLYMYNYIFYCIYLCYYFINKKIEFIIYRDDGDILGVEEIDMVISVRSCIIYLNSFMDLFEYVIWFFNLRKKSFIFFNSCF